MVRKSIWNMMFTTWQRLGDIWTSQNAEHCKSLPGNGEKTRVCFRNRCDYPLILCWMSESGQPHHFYRLDPSCLVGNVTADDHIETSFCGHAFLLAHVDKEDMIASVQKRKSLQETILVGGYRPRRTCEDKNGVHLVEIIPTKRFCRYLRGCGPGCDDYLVDDWTMTVSVGHIDPTPLDTTCKEYIATTLGGWPVRLEKGFNKKMPKEYRANLERDLKVLNECLPPHAKEALKACTPIWINCDLKYGPKAAPVSGIGCCFHPEQEWLIENGCHPEKHQCVELYNMNDYNRTRGHWGPGGVMLHEYAHAYHFKCLEDGYDNKEILECYKAAMKEGLYECVKVHGPQGPECKAYACSNQMEYFAELSAAFLGGMDDSEYNKWFPFNRKQIQQHDPRAYEMLKKVWRVD